MSLDDYIDSTTLDDYIDGTTIYELRTLDIDDFPEEIIKHIEARIDEEEDLLNYLHCLDAFDKCEMCRLGDCLRTGCELGSTHMRLEERYQDPVSSVLVYLLNVWFDINETHHCKHRQYKGYELETTIETELKKYEESSDEKYLIFAAVKALFHRDAELIPVIHFELSKLSVGLKPLAQKLIEEICLRF
jgi:hypothetical protein